MIDINRIRDVMPHRYPFLLVDRIVDVNEDGTKCTGVKNITANESVVQGHLPGMSIFPGVLLVEHMAQVGCYLLMTKPDAESKLAYFAAIDEVRFKRPVVPGDQVVTTVELLSGRRGIWKIKAESRVQGNLACRGVLTCVLVDY